MKNITLMCLVFWSAGTTEEKLIDVLTQRSNAQRLLISDAYQKATSRVHTGLHLEYQPSNTTTPQGQMAADS